MEFLFIVESDAYLKGAVNIAKSLNFDISSKIFSTKRMLVGGNIAFFDIEDSELCNIVFNSDALFLGMGGKNLNKFIKKSREISSQSKIIGYFPGVVHLNILESLTTRLLCDLVLLNSRSDYEVYRSISEKLLGFNNGVLFGAPWVSQQEKIDKSSEIDLLFVEQSIVPHSIYLRRKLLSALCDLAQKNKEKKIVIALRAKKGTESSHKVLYPLDEFKIAKIPNNLTFSYSDISELINISTRVATVSSSAAYISIIQGKYTYFVSNFGVRREYGNDFFEESGMFYKIDEVFLKNPESKKWQSLNVQGMDVSILNDICKVMKNEFSSIPRGNIYNLFNIIFWIKLSFLKNQSLPSLLKLYKSVLNINAKIYRC